MRTEDWTTPEDVRDLRRPEHLLVLALRAIAIGHPDCQAIQRGFADACGARGESARLAFFLLVKQVGMTSRRRLSLHMPGCVCLSPDERAIVAVIASAQDALASGDDTRLRTQFHSLIDRTPNRGFLDAALIVADALQANGHRLPQRVTEPVAAPRPTLH